MLRVDMLTSRSFYHPILVRETRRCRVRSRSLSHKTS